MPSVTLQLMWAMWNISRKIYNAPPMMMLVMIPFTKRLTIRAAKSYQNSGGSKTEQAGCNGMKHNASLNFFTVLYGTSQCDAVSVTNVASCRKPAGYAGNLDAGRFD